MQVWAEFQGQIVQPDPEVSVVSAKPSLRDYISLPSALRCSGLAQEPFPNPVPLQLPTYTHTPILNNLTDAFSLVTFIEAVPTAIEQPI